jgi:hypothetical protein
MEGFGPRVAAGFAENCGMIVKSVPMGQDSSERVFTQLASDMYKPRMIVKVIKRIR